MKNRDTMNWSAVFPLVTLLVASLVAAMPLEAQRGRDKKEAAKQAAESAAALAREGDLEAAGEQGAKHLEAKVAGMKSLPGFFDLYWDEATGKLFMTVDRFDEEFLYVTSLASGVGSNDIGLDRGQMGSRAMAEFRRIGPKVLLVNKNYRYRAITDDDLERRAVAESFAESAIWGFEVVAASQDAADVVLIDVTEFLLRDAHQISTRLEMAKQGSFTLDASRSALYQPNTRNFPKNTEMEATLTYGGTPKGAWIRSVTPSPDSVTVRQHHSFVELPDDGFEPREWDTRSSFIPVEFYDYATPISEPLVTRYAERHRLEKKDPTAERSEPVEPIVYYLDPGTPEPIRSALLDGARWWNQAYEAAGYIDAFRVEMLPADADPMDLHYNLIQWVHRSTRGWSYGGSIVDPRTGEILKGKVTLGSLRVRQDFLIAEGLLAPYEDGTTVPPEMEQMALARLRQLSAHEVGHTIGLMHNYAASTNGRESVMDYPHPLVEINEAGDVTLENSYDVGIGEWDKWAVAWGYQDFPAGTDEKSALDQLLAGAREAGLDFITDEDARPPGSAHPTAHLWDNGKDAAAELDRIMEVRRVALDKFGEKTIRNGTPMTMIEDVLVPTYLLHRFQIEAAAKVVGGMDYTYAVRGDGQDPTEFIGKAEQQRALQSLLRTLEPSALTLDEKLLELIPPRSAGLSRGRENFPSRTGVTFDPVTTAEVAAEMTVSFLLHPERASRLVVNNARRSDQLGLQEVIDQLVQVTLARASDTGLEAEVQRVVDRLVARYLMGLAVSEEASGQAKALAFAAVGSIAELQTVSDNAEEAHRAQLRWLATRFIDEPEDFELPDSLPAPDGSPIGSGEALCSWNEGLLGG